MVPIIRIALDKTKAKTLVVTYSSDQRNNVQLNKIRSIPGRQYDKVRKVWKIPYRYIRMFVNKFDDGIIKLEDDVDINYQENYFYDFLSEIELLKQERFKKFARYIISNAPKEYFEFEDNTSNITERVSLTIQNIKLIHAVCEHQVMPEVSHDIAIISTMVKDMYGFNSLEINPDTLNIDCQYVYNMYWKEIEQCVRTHDKPYVKAKTRLQKIVNECHYLIYELSMN